MIRLHKCVVSPSSTRYHVQYFVQMYTIRISQINEDKVSIVHFHAFFFSVLECLRNFVANLLLSRFTPFCVNFWGPKLRSRKFFDKYDVCLKASTALIFPVFIKVVVFRISPGPEPREISSQGNRKRKPWKKIAFTSSPSILIEIWLITLSSNSKAVFWSSSNPSKT